VPDEPEAAAQEDGPSQALKPIENSWSWMKVQLRESKATNLQELQQDVTRLWVLKMDDS
jgi:hypothetical protein